VERILDKEFELWHEYYDNENMRHLFVEYPFYTAEFLNMWMQADNDDILEELYSDWAGTLGDNPYTKEFLQKIKSECPETIFHGTDVGHQYWSTGERYLEYLENNSLNGSEKYLLAEEAIGQGKFYYGRSNNVYRENMMAENFIREYDSLSDEDIMGIYGAAHIIPADKEYHIRSFPCMADQIKERYGDFIYLEDLFWLMEEPYRVDMIKVNEKDYEASYYGKQDMTGIKDYSYKEIWRLENAYDDFKSCPKTENVLPNNNYPMPIDIGEVFIIDITKTDGSVERTFYRSDGNTWRNLPSTEEFTVK
jgi:hypothetical protein